METFFIGIYNYFEKRRIVFYLVFFLSLLVTGWFAAHVKFEEDISKVLPKDKQIEKLNQVFQNSKFMDKLVVMISLKDSNAPAQPDSLVEFAGPYASAIRAKLGPLVGKLSDQVDDAIAMDLLNTITDHLPVYLDQADYQDIDSLITPATVAQSLRRDINTLNSPAGFGLKKIILRDPVGISFLGLKKLKQLQYDDNFELYDSYVMTKDHRHLLIFLTPAFAPNNTGKNAELLQGLDQIADSLQQVHSQRLEADYFGAVAVSVGNALQLRTDTLFTQGITVVFLFVFIGLYFRKKTAPFLILIPVGFGTLFALAAIYFLRGTISVIALGSGSVVLGVAVNYSLHVFNHYRYTNNIREMIRDLTLPLTVGSFTTIGGFLCLEFLASDMLKDLGLFAAFSLIGASLCSLIFLPHFIRSRPGAALPQLPRSRSWIDRVAAYRPEYNKYLVLAIVALTCVFWFTANWVSFESDLTDMNFMSAKLKRAENKLKQINIFSLQSVYLVSDGNTLNEALANNEKMISKIEALRSQGIVKKFSGVSSLIISDSLQRVKIDRWNAFWTTEKKQALMSTLRKEGSSLQFKPDAFDPFQHYLQSSFSPVDTAAMSTVRENYLNDYITEKPGGTTVVTLVKVAAENKPVIYRTFEHDSTVTVLDRQYLTHKFVDLINSDFNSIALMSSLLVFAVLLLTYGRIELTLVSFIPMVITFIWILGIMGIFGVQFNIINIIISAFIFGLGDDYSLFIMDGLLQEYKMGRQNLSSFKSSIFLSAITTVAGLGVLIFAKHPALRSIAIISMVGIICVVIMSQILIPFLFALLVGNRVKKKRFPWTLWGLIRSVFAFSYFAIGSVVLTLAGVLLVKLNPFSREKGKYLYHLFISKYCWSLVYIMVNVKKRRINPLGEDFSKPAIIICNHQSFLDILFTVLLYPKLILFTNHWVWNSPVFGALVRMADYYPVMHGLDSNLDELAGRIQQGYSLVVFPEGTRSLDGQMKRFHKGAFLLAEKLGVDILPLVIHGSGYTLSKGDFLLKNGTVTLKFLPRIHPLDTRFGLTYAEKAKRVGRYFREQYNQLARQLEEPAYFREQLRYNYLYKGPVLEWYLRIKLRLEKDYQVFHELLPRQGHVLDLGCGYGFLTYLLHFSAPERQLTGVDYDQEKTQVASCCFSRNERIQFRHADVKEFALETYDGIVLCDVLHYLEPEKQKQLVGRCIRSLLPGGIMLIRDGDTDQPGKHRKTQLTEFFSTKMFQFNKTNGHALSFFSAGTIRQIALEHSMHCDEIELSRYTSNKLFVISHAPRIHLPAL
jgi:1-acyl-sn-glycerol-3-phosphate acyltransferase